MENEKLSDYNLIAFSLLSPICQELMKCPTEDTALKLKSLIDDLPSESLQVYQRYIFTPLCVSLTKKHVRLNVKIHIADCLSNSLQKTKVVELDQFMRIFSESFRLISDHSLQKVVPNIPEELKLSVVKCVTMLISSSSPEVLAAFYCEKNIPLISHGIYFCLELAKEELFVNLRLLAERVAALECLLHVCQVHGRTQHIDIDTCIKIGDILMLCFPGITLGLKKVICADEKQNHKITVMAIRAWSLITAKVMEDGFMSEAEETEDDDDWVASKNDLLAFLDKKKECCNSDPREYMLTTLKEKKRTKEWYLHASRSIYPIVSEICQLYFSNWNVRMEMVLAAERLLNCSRNMKECVPSLAGVLLILSEDEVVGVSEKSKAALDVFAMQFDQSCSLSLIEVMEDHFLKVTHKVSLSTLGEEDLNTSLNLMCGYLRLLGRHAHHLIRSCIHLNAMLSALIKTATLDYFTISPVEDWSLGTSDLDILKASVPWKCFKHFKSKSIFIKFKDICLLLGQYSDHSLLSDYLLQLFYEDMENQREITLIINEIFSNVTSSQSENVFPIIKRIIKSYLDPEVWQYEQIGGREMGTVAKKHIIADIKSKTIQACLLVEGLGMLGHVTTSVQASASSLDSWYFRVCLYPILERIGQPNPMLAGAGKLAMAHISQAMGVSIANIIVSNSDYVIRHIVLKLRNASGFSSPAPLHVLVAVLEFSSPNILNDLEEAVESVVNYGFKYVNDSRASNCLKCLLVFTTFVKSKFPKCKNLKINIPGDADETDCPMTNNSASKKAIGPVTIKILDFKRLRETANSSHVEDHCDSEKQREFDKECEGDEYTNKTECIEEILTGDDETKEKPPKHVMLTVQVLQQIVAFVSSKDKERKLMAMDILSKGTQIVEGYDDELLPLVHKIWNPLSAQFKSDDPLVMQHAFNLLLVLAVVAKNFIRDRTLRKVLPEISKFLIKQSVISYKKDSASAYRFSQAYKLQHILLYGLGELAVNLEFQEQDLSEMLTATAPYLSSLQPQPLQDACVKTYKLACTLDHNIVYLKLAHIGNLFQDMKLPSPEFMLYQVPKQTKFGIDYCKNVSLLITYLLNGS